MQGYISQAMPVMERDGISWKIMSIITMYYDGNYSFIIHIMPRKGLAVLLLDDLHGIQIRLLTPFSFRMMDGLNLK